MTYKAIVCRIHTRPHPNADRLQLGTCLGNQVIVGLDTQDNELGGYFGSDGQLSEVFCEKHDLVGYTDPATGEKRGGYFGKNRRVRTQKFRGERSDGYWVPLHYFSFTGVKLASLREGDQFDTLNGTEICRKYVTPATSRAMQQQGKTSRGQTKMFPKHKDTEQFRFYADKIPLGALVIISEKLHGCSHRLAYVIDNPKAVGIRAFAYRILDSLGIQKKPRWVELHGSRNVILDKNLSDPYYDDAFRGKAVAKLRNQLR